MMPEDGRRADEDFASWAAACDESLAAGHIPEPPAAAASDPSLRERQERFQACLRRLEQDRRTRPQSAPGATLPEAGDGSTALSLPAELGRFRLVRVLGAGGFGVVYLAEDPRLGRQVALKVPRPEALLTPDLRQRFVRETRAAARLSHPNILPVFESGEAGPSCFLVAAYCAGGSLAAWLARRPLPPRAAAALTATLARAVQHAHEHGVLHRDLKPANVLLEPLGDGEAEPWAGFRFRPRIADFGLAKLVDDLEDESSSPTAGTAGPEPRPTRTGALLGTPSYMAPEQAEGRRRDIGPATDVYGLGAVLYELLTGRPPFRDDSGWQTLRRVVTEEVVPPRRLRPDVPRDLEAICLKCLAKWPVGRYASAADLADDLQRFQAGLATRARPVGAWSRAARWCRRHRALAALLAVVVLGLPVLAGGIGWYQYQLHAYEQAMRAAAEREGETAATAEAERERVARLQAYAASTRHASEFWARGQNQAAEGNLAAQVPPPGGEDLRGFEYWYLWGQVRGPRLLGEHPGGVAAVAFSPDGRLCASAGREGAIRVWDTRSGRPLAQWQWPGAGNFQVLRFAPDGRRLVSVRWADSATVQVWDAATGEPLLQRTGPKNKGINAISPDGQAITQSSCLDPYGPNNTARVLLWEVGSGHERVLWSKRRAGCTVTALSFAPEGRVLAVSYTDGLDPSRRIRLATDLVELPSGTVRATLNGHKHFIFALAFTPDGAALASGSCDGIVKLWDTATGQEKKTLYLGQPVKAVAFAPGGRTLAVGTWPYLGPDNKAWSVSVWDVNGGTRLAPELRPGCGINDLAYAPDGRTIAVAVVNDPAVRLWELEPRAAFVSLSGHQPAEAWAVAFAPDGKTLASGGDDHAVRLWDLATGQQRAVLGGHQSLVTCVAVSPDGKRVAGGGFDKAVRVWDAATRQVVFTGTHGHIVTRVAFSPDGRLLASSDRDRTVRVGDAETGAPRATLTDHENYVRGLAFVGPRRLATGCNGGRVRLWDLDTGQALWVVQDTADIYCLTCSPDGSLLATGNRAGLVRLREAATGREVRTLRGHLQTVMPDGSAQGGVRSVAFSPDGKTLASAGEDRAIRLWQVATGLEVLCFKDQPHFINGVAFSPDGTYLAAALHDGSIRLWHGSPGE